MQCYAMPYYTIICYARVGVKPADLETNSMKDASRRHAVPSRGQMPATQRAQCAHRRPGPWALTRSPMSSWAQSGHGSPSMCGSGVLHNLPTKRMRYAFKTQSDAKKSQQELWQQASMLSAAQSSNYSMLYFTTPVYHIGILVYMWSFGALIASSWRLQRSLRQQPHRTSRAAVHAPVGGPLGHP